MKVFDWPYSRPDLVFYWAEVQAYVTFRVGNLRAHWGQLVPAQPLFLT